VCIVFYCAHLIIRLPMIQLLSDEKIFHLCSNDHTKKLRAVQNRAFIVVPFSASTLGVRIGALAYNLAEAISALIRGEALPSLQFSHTPITDNGSVQAVGKSGVRVFEKLPIWNGTDLNELCPGSSVPIQIRDDIPLATAMSESNSDKLALGLGLGLGFISLLLLGFAGYTYQKSKLMEKQLDQLKMKAGATSA